MKYKEWIRFPNTKMRRCSNMKKALLSENAHTDLILWLKDMGLEIQKIPCINGSPIGTHPDLYFCQMSCSDNGDVFSGTASKVGQKYPGDCIYNAASTGRFFIHNTNITDPELLDAAKAHQLDIIHVRQGYTKCSCVVVDENSIITSDAGIARACRNKMDCLLISPGHVILEGYDYGFLGGASGRLEDTIIFNGDLQAHPDREKIRSFITERGLKIKYFDSYPLTDIGSILISTE